MTTLQNGDSFLVQRTDSQSGISTNYQVSQENLMANLADDDLLLVQRTSAGISTNYSITGSALKEDLGGPDGLITPPVAVLTPLNGAGLNDGDPYTPMSSAYVSTDSTPIYNRYFPQVITTVSGGTWTDENEIFDANNAHYASLSGTADVVSQAVYLNRASDGLSGETQTWAYAASGGTIEVIDENDNVLRTYTMPTSASRSDIGIVRADNKIRYTTANTNDTLYIAKVTLGVGPGETPGYLIDSVIPGRVALEFTDDTDLDKMVAPIIMTDENGNVKVPTTSTVDSTTTVAGEGKSTMLRWYSTGSTQTWAVGLSGPGPRMVWAKSDFNRGPAISDNVVNYGKYLLTSHDSAAAIDGPLLEEDESIYNPNNSYNKSGDMNYIAEIGVAPKILDIVSYSGDGTSMQEVPHNLGVKPGMIIVKSTNYAAGWAVWHKDLTSGYRLNLNNDNAEHQSTNTFASEPTKDAFYVGANGQAGAGGYDYVAYVFAEDSPGKVMCGSYIGNGANQFVYPGFEPGFVLIKRKAGSSDWIAATPHTAMDYKYWYPNRYEYGVVGNSGAYIGLSNNYFVANSGHADWNTSGQEYVYLAVAKDLTGPNSTQLNLLSGQDLEYFTTGTQITSNAPASGSNISFGSFTYSGTNQLWLRQPSVGGDTSWYDIRSRTGNKWLTWIKSSNQGGISHHMFDSERGSHNPIYADLTLAENTTSNDYMYPYDSGAGYRTGSGSGVNAGYNYISWNFLTAPQFFDIQKYIGNGITGHTIQHDLGVEPGFIMIKNTRDSKPWVCYHHELGFAQGMSLDSHSPVSSVTTRVTGATSSDFTLGTSSYANNNSDDYISYIFAKDTPYVKCGTYTATGQDNFAVDIGFKPRWMLIKSITSGYSWVILDKELPNQRFTPDTNAAADGLEHTFTSTGVTFRNNLNTASVNSYDVSYIYVAIADESEGHPPAPPSTSTVTETPDPNTAQMVVNAESFDVGATASAPALEASITSVGGSEGNKLFVDASTGTWMPGLYAKGSETTIDAPGPDEITFTSQNQGTPAFSGVDATLSTRTWTLESGPSATGPWTLVDSYVDYDALNSQDGATPWSSNKPSLTPNTFYRVKVQYNSTNAESVESVYNTFKTGDA